MLLAIPFAIAAAPPPPATAPDFHPERLLLKPGRGAETRRGLAAFHQQQRVRVLKEFAGIEGIQLLRLPPGQSVSNMLERYRQSGLVEFAEPDLRLALANTPNDPAFASGASWHLLNTGQSSGTPDADIDAPEAWDLLTGATNVLVATIDSGARHTHEDLAANIWINPGEIPGNGVDDDSDGYVDNIYGINAAAGTGLPADLIGHGSMVAGLIGAVGNNGVGGTGVAWRTKLLICRFTDDAGNVFLSTAATAMDYARSKGAQIINTSFINTLYSGTLYAAINSCRTAGIIVVAAAGNDSVNTDNTPYYPASYNLDNIVSVAATTRTDALASYSNYGATSVDLAAPGTDVFSTFNTSDTAYNFNSGTSFSAPIVSGALALLRARFPSATYRQLINQLLGTTDPLPSLAGKCVSGGRLNLARALNSAVAARFTASPAAGVAPLIVRFTNTSVGLPERFAWDFGDSATSDEPDPAHTYALPGSYLVRLTVTGSDGGTSSTNRTIHVVNAYTMTNVPFAWIDPAGMASLNLTGNAVSPAQTLPFPFRFFGESYTAVHVSANGLLGFEISSLGNASNTDLPNAAAPNNIICPFWDDLNPAATSVRFGIAGAAPNRNAVISWIAAAGTGNPSVSFSFQAILQESSNDILFQYLDVQPDSRNAGAAGKTATVGIEHRSGLVATRYSYNGSRLLSNALAMRFVAPRESTNSVTNTPPQAVALLNPAWNGDAFTFSFTGHVGRVYVPQYLDFLNPALSNWTALGIVTGSGGLLQITNQPAPSTHRFYRVESQR